MEVAFSVLEGRATTRAFVDPALYLWIGDNGDGAESALALKKAFFGVPVRCLEDLEAGGGSDL